MKSFGGGDLWSVVLYCDPIYCIDRKNKNLLGTRQYIYTNIYTIYISVCDRYLYNKERNMYIYICVCAVQWHDLLNGRVRISFVFGLQCPHHTGEWMEIGILQMEFCCVCNDGRWCIFTQLISKLMRNELIGRKNRDSHNAPEWNNKKKQQLIILLNWEE